MDPATHIGLVKRQQSGFHSQATNHRQTDNKPWFSKECEVAKKVRIYAAEK